MNPASQYILEKPEPFRSILLHLQATIVKQIPDATLMFKWKLSFFYIEAKPFCFLNLTTNYVDLVFWHGSHLTVHSEVLVSKGRKHMKSLRYKSLKDVNQKILNEVLSEAYSRRSEKYYK